MSSFWKKRKSAIGFVDTGIYPYEVLISSNYTSEYIESWLSENTGDVAYKMSLNTVDLDAYTCKTISSTCQFESEHLFVEPRYIVILNNLNLKNVESHISIAHECLHLVQFISNEVHSLGRELEGEAYLHSYLMRKIYSLLNNEGI